MSKKTISINSVLWKRMNALKNELNENSKKVYHWNDTIEHILNHYTNNKEQLKEKKNAIPTPPQKSIRKPSKPSLPPLNISIPAPKLPNLTKKGKNPIMSKENLNLSIPAPPKKKAIVLDVSPEKLEELAKKETKDTRYIMIECQICGNIPILMPVPKALVLDAKEPVVDVSYIHGDPQHVIVAQLDHDFQVRRRRASWVVYEKDYK
ncbi:hypothetical protein NEF87_002648 [Candidatus Lokiarchaeum ossiferum]|uniref:Uncharacterized protein n=1 Tax=Candidatus Lokiarchaeum ossiferum TaxID=2951803 RepID=A0ABY6HS75_9ARCH|nr:hypothetical protein NEF87_002648 [Candidatus Lokiarchaeum sp. B-35]